MYKSNLRSYTTTSNLLAAIRRRLLFFVNVCMSRGTNTIFVATAATQLALTRLRAAAAMAHSALEAIDKTVVNEAEGRVACKAIFEIATSFAKDLVASCESESAKGE